MQAAGYRTHMIGKWHLGHLTEAQHPLYRGFETFYGFYGSNIDYWTKGTAALYLRALLGGELDLEREHAPGQSLCVGPTLVCALM